MILPNSSPCNHFHNEQNFSVEESALGLAARRMFRICSNQLPYALPIIYPLGLKNQNIFGINLTDFLLQMTDGANLNRHHSTAWKFLLSTCAQDSGWKQTAKLNLKNKHPLWGKRQASGPGVPSRSCACAVASRLQGPTPGDRPLVEENQDKFSILAFCQFSE